MNAFGRCAQYEIVENYPGMPLIIKDIGPWDEHPSVTNDVEWVVEDLFNKGLLLEDRQLYCYDSNGDLDELVHISGKFVEFKVGPSA